ncbi:hypothetical protein SMICM304S_11448 [Streptomyces microflavus]
MNSETRRTFRMAAVVFALCGVSMLLTSSAIAAGALWLSAAIIFIVTCVESAGRLRSSTSAPDR